MRRRSPLRWLAPVALVACAVAVYSVVNATLLTSDDSAGGTSTTRTSATGPESSTSTTASRRSSRSKRSKAARTYTIRAGDTLSSVAAKTGVSLERIQQLNPKLDSNSLQTGERVKLSP